MLSSEAEALAIEVSRLVNLEMAIIDPLFCEQGYKVCEANCLQVLKVLSR